MIEFMVIGLPRSGTTWLSNWLTTDTTLCLHDPTASYTLPDLDALTSTKTLGIADTALALNPKWVNDHSARKLVLIRDHEEINESLANAGLPLLDPILSKRLLEIKAPHILFQDLFNPATAQKIYEYLTLKPFDAERHKYLTELNVQTKDGAVEMSMPILRDFIERIKKNG